MATEPAANNIDEMLAQRAREKAAGGAAKGTPIPIDLDKVKDNPFQHRSEMDERKLEELMAGIEQNGLIQPVLVRASPDGNGYQLIAGHRRTEAYRRLREQAKSKGDGGRWNTIPGLIRPNTTDTDMRILGLEENLKREDPSPMDYAQAFAELRDGMSLTLEQIAERHGYADVSQVERYLRLHDAPAAIKDALHRGLRVTVQTPKGEKTERRTLELTSAILYVRLHRHLTEKKKKKPETATELVIKQMERALTEGWGRRRIEEEVDKLQNGRAEKPASKETKAAPFFKSDAKIFTLYLDKLPQAPDEERAKIRDLLQGYLKQLG